MTSDLARRRSLLSAALGFAPLATRGQPAPPEVQTARTWLGKRAAVEPAIWYTYQAQSIRLDDYLSRPRTTGLPTRP